MYISINDFLKKTKKQKGGGPYVKITKKMIKEMQHPSKEIKDTIKSDCAIATLTFFGIDMDIFEEVLNKFKTSMVVDKKNIMTTKYELDVINKFEKRLRDNNSSRINEDTGGESKLVEIPMTNTENLLTDDIFDNIFSDLKNGYISTLSYRRDLVNTNDKKGHILIRGKENNGSPFILDLQTSRLIKGKDKIIQHFLSRKKKYILTVFKKFVGGLFLKSNKNTKTIFKGHSPVQLSEKFKQYVEHLDVQSKNTNHSQFVQAVNPQAPAVNPQAPAVNPQAPAVNPQAQAVNPQAQQLKNILFKINKEEKKFIIRYPNGKIENLDYFEEALFKAGAGQYKGAVLILEKEVKEVKEVKEKVRMYNEPRSAEELSVLYPDEQSKFPSWALDLYKNKEEWKKICDTIKYPILEGNSESQKKLLNYNLVKRKTTSEGDKRENYKSGYERIWYKSLGLYNEEIEEWPNLNVQSKKKVREIDLPENIIMLVSSPMTQTRWENKKMEKMVNILNVSALNFGSKYNPEFQKFYLHDLNIEQIRRITLKDNIDKYIIKKGRKGNLDWLIEKVNKSKKFGIFHKGQFGYFLIEYYINLYKKILDLVIKNGKKILFFSKIESNFIPEGISQENFNNLVINPVFENLLNQKISKNEINYNFKGKYKNVLVFENYDLDTKTNKLNSITIPNYYLKGYSEKLFSKEDEIQKIILQKYPKLKDIKGKDVVYINFFGNNNILGDKNGKGIDASFGINSTIALLGWPITNPNLALKVGYIPSQKKRVPFDFGKENSNRNRKNTKKKFIYPKPKSNSRYDKLMSYFLYCEMIKDLYKDKHEEVKKLIFYLKELFDTCPDLSVDSPIIRDILEQLSKGIINFDLDKANDDLLEKIKEQERLMEEAKTHVEKIGLNVEKIKDELNESKIRDPTLFINELEKEYPKSMDMAIDMINKKQTIDNNLLNILFPIKEEDITDPNLKKHGFHSDQETELFIKNVNIFKKYKLFLVSISIICKNEKLNLLQILKTEQNKNHFIKNLKLIIGTVEKIAGNQNQILEKFDPYLATLNYYINDYLVENKNTFQPSKFNISRQPIVFINNYLQEFNKVFLQARIEIKHRKVTDNIIIKVFPIHLNKFNNKTSISPDLMRFNFNNLLECLAFVAHETLPENYTILLIELINRKTNTPNITLDDIFNGKKNIFLTSIELIEKTILEFLIKYKPLPPKISELMKTIKLIKKIYNI